MKSQDTTSRQEDHEPLLHHANTNEVWQSFAHNRLTICRLVFVSSVVIVVAKLLGLAVSSAVTFDVYQSAVSVVVCGLGLYTTKVRDNLPLIVVYWAVWCVLHTIFCIAALVFIWNDGKSFIYPLGTREGEDMQLTTASLRYTIVPFVSVVGMSGMGVPSSVFVPLGTLMFVMQTILAVSFTVHVMEVDATDLIQVLVNNIFNAALLLYVGWTAELHQRKAREHSKLLKHSLARWIEQKDADLTTRNRIVGYIFHEVRNPLNNIMLASDVLTDRLSEISAKDFPHKLEIADLVSTITTAADSACHVLNDALSLQKLEAGTFEFVKQPFSLVKFQSQAIRVAAPMMQQKHITLSSHMDQSLEELNVFGDFNRLQQVLNNFLSNAYKFTPNHGSISVRMTEQAKRVTNDGTIVTVRTSVQDSGTGIPIADHSRVFLPWSQIRASDLQQGQGSGLGLSLCKAFVETGHGGRIGFTSDAGAGSTFFFEVDFHIHEDSPAVAQRTSASQPGGIVSVAAVPNARNSPALPHRRTLTPSTPKFRTRTSTPPSESGSNSRQSTANTTSATNPPAAVPKNRNQSMAKVYFPNNDVDANGGSGVSPTSSMSGSVQHQPPQLLEPAVSLAVTNVTEASPLCRADTDITQATKDVLIVDDSLVTRKLLSKILDVLSVTFDTCENGKEAVDRVLMTGCIYKLIFMDKEMPIMDGFEATRTLRAGQYDLPIVGLTGNAMDDQVADFLSAGVNDVFSKPIKRDALIRVLTQYSIQAVTEPPVEAQNAPPNLAPNDLHPRHAHHAFDRKSLPHRKSLSTSISLVSSVISGRPSSAKYSNGGDRASTRRSDHASVDESFTEPDTTLSPSSNMPDSAL